MMTKRTFLGGAAAAAGAGLIAVFANRGSPAMAARFEIELTEDEWRQRLEPAAFRVLRRQGTERPGSSPLNQEHRAGTYACAGCDLPVFRSADKFESGTGWPSFIRAIPENVATQPDNGLFGARTEVHCRRCGGHLGHVFDDGPAPTGQRWCMNGVAMRFVPGEA
jgi:peptide-methionine (R)-S-oxide reductase